MIFTVKDKLYYMDGQKYFDEVCQFLHDEYGFIWVSS